MKNGYIRINGKPMLSCDYCGEVLKREHYSGINQYKNGKFTGVKSVMACAECDKQIKIDNIEQVETLPVGSISA